MGTKQNMIDAKQNNNKENSKSLKSNHRKERKQRCCGKEVQAKSHDKLHQCHHDLYKSMYTSEKIFTQLKCQKISLNL